jgi:hypothetical protein
MMSLHKCKAVDSVVVNYEVVSQEDSDGLLCLEIRDKAGVIHESVVASFCPWCGYKAKISREVYRFVRKNG